MAKYPNLPVGRETAICNCGDHAFFGVTKGYVALVSPEDRYLADERLWHAKVNRRVVYVSASSKDPSRRGCLHLLILPGKTGQVDHINKCGLDNRRCNLRRVSAAENSQNRRYSRPNKVGVLGVCQNVITKKFKAKLKRFGVVKRLGTFATLEEAAQAVAEAERIFALERQNVGVPFQ